jgi:hypothetical protein
MGRIDREHPATLCQPSFRLLGKTFPSSIGEAIPGPATRRSEEGSGSEQLWATRDTSYRSRDEYWILARNVANIVTD